MTEPALPAATAEDHLSWVRTRMTLDAEMMEWVRHGFSLIAVGFGSFAFLQGVVGAAGEGEGPHVTEPSRVFSLIVTAIGVAVILLAANHNRKMTAWVNADEYGAGPVPELPNEQRTSYLAGAAILIGLISFIALLFLK